MPAIPPALGYIRDTATKKPLNVLTIRDSKKVGFLSSLYILLHLKQGKEYFEDINSYLPCVNDKWRLNCISKL